MYIFNMIWNNQHKDDMKYNSTTCFLLIMIIYIANVIVHHDNIQQKCFIKIFYDIFLTIHFQTKKTFPFYIMTMSNNNAFSKCFMIHFGH